VSPLHALIAATALIPAMTGPARQADGSTLVLALCNGGSITVQTGGSNAPAGPPMGPCCAKGCQIGDRRKGIDPKQ
jgi:hypothetical protein